MPVAGVHEASDTKLKGFQRYENSCPQWGHAGGLGSEACVLQWLSQPELSGAMRNRFWQHDALPLILIPYNGNANQCRPFPLCQFAGTRLLILQRPVPCRLSYRMNSSTSNSVNDKSASGNVHWRRYLTWYLSTFLLACALVASFNAVIDPHARVLILDRTGFNQIKPVLKTNDRKSKANALRQCSYDTIVLGSSRAEMGIPVEHPALMGARAYNAALKAGSMYEMRRVAAYAMLHQNLDTVLLGLDYESFYAELFFSDDFADSPFAEAISLPSVARYLFSLSTFWESFGTLKANLQGTADLCGENGEHKRTRALQPARIAFDTILRRFARGQYRQYSPGEQHIAHLADAVRQLTESNVKVYAFFSPAHVMHLELMTEMGLLNDFENWKRNVVQVFEEANRSLPEDKRATLWDFSGYSEITTERVPNPENEKFMNWYTDSSHFNQKVGNLIIDRMFDQASYLPKTETPFGIRLTPDNMEAVIEQSRRDSKRYRNSNPDEIARMQAMLRNIE